MVANGIARRRGIVVLAVSVLLVAVVGVGAARAMLATTPMTIQPQLNAGGYINDIEVSGNTAYIVGSFTTVGGQARANLAAFDLTTGNVLSWNPNSNNTVNTVDVSGSDVYVGGSFTTIGTNSASRNYAAKIDSAGSATSWNPSPSNTVNAIDVRNSVAYIGGSFVPAAQTCSSTAGASLSTVVGSACEQGFPAVTGGTMYVTARDGNGGWYIGGSFTTVGGLARVGIAHIQSDGSVDTSWNPTTNGTVYSIVVSSDNNTVYTGGQFTTIGGQSRNRIAALNASDGLATTWNPDSNGDIRSLALYGSTIYAGGTFNGVNCIGGQTRNYLAAISTSTGNATSWDPAANSTVRAVAVSPDGNTVYAGGGFWSLGGQARMSIGAVNASDALATTWNPNPSNWVYQIVISSDGNTVYASGGFNSIGGQVRNFIGAVNASDGLATAWNPNASGGTEALAISSDGNTIYAGGYFTTIGGQSRNRIAALNVSDGLATDWDPNADGSVFAVSAASDGRSVYAGGSFSTIGGLGSSIGGQMRNYIAAIDANGDATSWNPNANGTVNELKLSSDGNTAYASGGFTSIGGQSRNKLAALSSSTGNATSWDPNPNNTVNTLAFSSDGQTVFAGGTFSSIGGQARNKLAAINTSTGNATSWDPDLDNTVNALAVTSSNEVFAAGSFDAVGELVRPKLTKIGTDGIATSWTPTPNQAPGSLAMWGDDLVVGAGSSPFSIFRYGYSDAVVRKGLGVFNDVTPPVNIAQPLISGDPVPKKNLSCGSGTWSSDASVTYSYSWSRNAVTIGQAQGSTYTVTSDDVGDTLSCVVTATNFAGSAQVASITVNITSGESTVVDPDAAPSAAGGGGGGTAESTGCRARGRIVSKSLRRALASGKIRVKVTTNKTGSTVNLHLRTDGVGAKLAARQNVTFSNGRATHVTLKLRPRAKQQLRRRVNKRMKRGQKKIAMRLRVYCFDGGTKTRTSTSQKMSVSKKKARSKKDSRSKPH